MIFTGALAVGGLMLCLWLIHFPMRNAAIVDAGWAGGLALLGILYAALGEGLAERKYLIGAMAGVWGLRLAFHLLTDRILGHPEEGRYRELRRQWVTNIPLKFLLFYEFQALLCVVLSAPFYLAARNPAAELTLVEYAAAALWLVSTAGESIA
ncbi:MAG: DUF1295 domain-containing protein, partial [Candidatus Solibacter sp.]|nr:DUF1295 domain-containing protein [Candidatus Solibacter sp.]